MKHTNYLLVILLMALALTACSVGTIQPPDRQIEITSAHAVAAQNTIFGALSTGQLTLSEAELSSYLTAMLLTNTGPNQPVDTVTTWIEPDNLYIRLTLKDGVLLEGAGNTLDLVGNFVIVDGQLQLELAQAGTGAFTASGPPLQIFAQQINNALAENLPALPVNIAQDIGVLTVGLGAARAPASSDAMASGETIADIVISAAEADDAEFTSLLAAVEVADFADLLSQEGPFTVFAPTDAAFEALPPGMLDSLLSSVISTQAVLQYHVLDGEFLAADVVTLDGQAVPTLFGTPLAINVEGDTVRINGEIQVIQTDIQASNGVIHVIDTVLIPER